MNDEIEFDVLVRVCMKAKRSDAKYWGDALPAYVEGTLIPKFREVKEVRLSHVFNVTDGEDMIEGQ